MIDIVRHKRGRIVVTLGGVALIAVVLAIAGAAFPAGARESWKWRTQGGLLVSAQSGADEITLSAESVEGEASALVVADNGQELQTMAASSDSSGAVLAFSVTDSSGSRAVVGVVRSDVAHLYATVDGSSQEIPMSTAGAFAVGGLPATATIALQALGSDGSTIETTALPQTSSACIGFTGCSRAPSAGAPRTAQGSGTTGIPRAFARPATPLDKLPANAPFRRGIIGAGGARQKILATRRIATYADSRGRRALLYLIRTKNEICEFTLWRGGAGGGCNNASDFFAGRHVVAGSGHLITGVVDEAVSTLVIVGTHGGRHRVTPTPDGGFIYDCHAYSGCTGCVVDHLEALNAAGQTIESDRVTGGCTRRTTTNGRASKSKVKDPSPLTVPTRLEQALVRRGYPVRRACGSVLEPPLPSGWRGSPTRLTSAPACWLVIYKDGYSVSIAPHSSSAAAKAVYKGVSNKWARDTRRVAIGPLLVSAFRIPEAEWRAIVRIVSASVPTRALDASVPPTPGARAVLRDYSRNAQVDDQHPCNAVHAALKYLERPAAAPKLGEIAALRRYGATVCPVADFLPILGGDAKLRYVAHLAAERAAGPTLKSVRFRKPEARLAALHPGVPELVVTSKRPKTVRGEWDAQLYAGTLAALANRYGLPSLGGRAGSFSGLVTRLPALDIYGQIPTPTQLETLRHELLDATARASATIVELRTAATPARAVAVTLRVSDPAAFLKHRAKRVLDVLLTTKTPLLGFYVGVEDARGKLIWEMSRLPNEGAIWVLPTLDGCSPIDHSRPATTQPLPCPAK